MSCQCALGAMATDPSQADLVNKDAQEQKQCEQAPAILESHLAACHAARPTAHLLQMVDSLLIEISLFLSQADAFCFSLVCSRLHQLLVSRKCPTERFALHNFSVQRLTHHCLHLTESRLLAHSDWRRRSKQNSRE